MPGIWSATLGGGRVNTDDLRAAYLELDAAAPALLAGDTRPAMERIFAELGLDFGECQHFANELIRHGLKAQTDANAILSEHLGRAVPESVSQLALLQNAYLTGILIGLQAGRDRVEAST